tara:strand:- start:242 stop:1894 length:1653 start_codon:yes stop_codon:yes gene_type:complete
MKFTPFPTFTNKQGITGIQPIQLPQARPSFPTARRQAPRRAPEPSTKEAIAGLLPLIPEFFAKRRRGKQPLMNMADFYTSIGANPLAPSREEEAQYRAYLSYGPQRDTNRLGGTELFNLVAASQMGRGAPAFVQSALALKKGRDAQAAAINQQRGQLIKEATKPDTYDYVNLIDTEAAALGMNATVSGRRNTRTGSLQVQLPEQDARGNYLYRNAGPNYLVQTSTTADITPPEDPTVKEFKNEFKLIDEKENALVGFNNVVQNTIKTLDSIGEGDLTPNTLTSALVGLGDRARIEFNNVSQLIGREGRLFGNVDDFAAGKSGAVGREGTGMVAEKLYKATQVLLQDPTNEEAIRMQEEALQELDGITQTSYGYTLRDKMDKTVFNDVRLRSQFLQLGYTAAAINGQTGRTLSDKDLAYHLEIVGLGQTTNPRVLKKNLFDYMRQSLDGVDAEINLKLQQLYPRYKDEILRNPILQSYINPYYIVPKDGERYLYPENIGTLDYRNFATRRPGFGFELYYDDIDYNNSASSGGSSDLLDLNTSLDNILGVDK